MQHQYRDIRTQPDPDEPSFSYEESHFWAPTYHDTTAGGIGNSLEDVEDEFHRRLASQQQRRSSSDNNFNNNNNNHINNTTTSFWRTTSTESNNNNNSNNNNTAAPAFSAVHIRNNENGDTGSGKGLLASELEKHNLQQQQQLEENNHNVFGAKSQQQWQTSSLRESSGSLGSTSKDIKRKKERERATERRLKLDAQSSDVDIGHIVDEEDEDDNEYEYDDVEEVKNNNNNNNQSDNNTTTTTTTWNNNNSTVPPMIVPISFADMRHTTALDRSSSDQSTGSLLYCKTPSTGSSSISQGVGGTATNNGGYSGILLGSSAALGKTSSLIFPTGVDSNTDGGERNNRADAESAKLKRTKVYLQLDKCEAVRFRKKKLMLDNLNLTAADIPIKDLIGTSLGNSLYKLSLAGNRLGSVPTKLVTNLPNLRRLDLSQCELHQLPDHWYLPKLTHLILSHNRFTEFPEDTILEGLPELQDLNMYGNKVAEITIPSNPKLLSKLEVLDLGYNDVVWLPDDLDQLKSLRVLKVMNNFLNKIPMRVCDMDLKIIDVSSNPVTEPPIETCERGICSMRRYWHCIRMEEQSKKKALAEVQKKLQRTTKKSYGRFMNVMKKGATSMGTTVLRKAVSTGTAPHDASVASAPPATTTTTAATAAAAAPRSNSVSGTTDSSQQQQEQKVAAAALAVPRPGQNEVKHSVSESKVDSDMMMSSPPFTITTTTDSPDSKIAADEVDNQIRIDPLEGASLFPDDLELDKVTVNDTLKVIFVGMAMVGKTSMIKRLMEGRDAIVPTRDERTVGVDIYDWEPKNDKRFEHIDSRIQFQDHDLAESCGDVDVKFSVWDFAGQHVYHATHELFFSNRALYVLVWDMGATNPATLKQQKRNSVSGEIGAFKLYDSSDDESDGETDFALEEEERRADRALEHDIDEKVQFWVDCIQSTAPGAAILPVASFDDFFKDSDAGNSEASRRCALLKERLLKHEMRRIEGIKRRLQDYHDQNRADDIAAVRLRKLLCSYTRPKLIFGDGDDAVVRVSGTEYTGFDKLTERIIGIATGQNKGQWQYPIFHGHVGARIPRMRLEVREAVRAMRSRFKVVEWGYFINTLRDHGLTSVEDISDALHFLTNTGELSYFGGVMTGGFQPKNPIKVEQPDRNDVAKAKKDDQASCTKNSSSENIDDEDEMDEDDAAMLSLDDTSITAPSTADGSLTTLDDCMSAGLSQFVFLNPRWLVAAVACILRHDLDREIKETRRLAASGSNRELPRTASFYDAHLNCPVITAEDACLLWQNKRITKKAAERAQEYSNNMTVTPFEFLQLLLIRFGVFVPIDLSIEKALFGGKEYQQLVEVSDLRSSNLDVSLSTEPSWVKLEEDSSTTARARFFFLPSLLGPCEPSDAWTYKSTDSWKATLCHSILFPDGVPPGLMERLTASVLSAIYEVSKRDTPGDWSSGQKLATYEGKLAVKEILCWRTAFYLKIGSQVSQADGTTKESVVEIFTHLAGRDSHLCVGSDFMGVGMRRLICSGRGQVGDGARKIWKGGYLLVCKCIHRVMMEYEGLEYETQGFCPDCLAKKAVSEASSWEMTAIRAAVLKSEESLRCLHGHVVDTRLVAGPFGTSEKPRAKSVRTENAGVPVQDLLGAVVVVGLWDGKTRKVVRVGSGFIADRKRGLIVTAAHTLMNIWGDKNYPFGENYYGLTRGKVVIGVIPQDKEGGKDMAVFRYFAQIVTKDPSLDHGECHLDACVLRITTRMENDVSGDGEGCGDQPEILLLNNQRALKQQHLPALKITDKCELEEQVRIVGYNQGGEGLLGPGEHLNRCVDFAKGYVCMKFVHEEEKSSKRQERFKPREEIVVICPTIGGHSGGPCVNQQGEVIGILSRADPAENQRCYLVPASELKSLVSRAKKQL